MKRGDVMKRISSYAAAVVVLIAAAASARPGDDDAETRFHRAYEHEVVDGKIADAARVYLAMMDDAQVPERLRQEAKFRFAVTEVLLGRADEARAHLAEIVRDPKTPDALRARAAEYLDAAKGIGVGTELDKKLQTLVFELGRATDVNSAMPACRDFEVIGKPAVPFLRQLLEHGDRAVRQQAFHILQQMREPGIMEMWTPELQMYDVSACADLRAYLEASPAETRTFERRLLALDDDKLSDVLDRGSQNSSLSPPVGADFLRAAAARKVPAAALVKVLEGTAYKDEALQRLRIDWIKSGRATLASAAALSFLAAARTKIPDWIDRTALLPVIVASLVDKDAGNTRAKWPTSANQGGPDGAQRDGFVAVASGAPLPVLLDAFDLVVTRGAAWRSEEGTNPFDGGLAALLAAAIDATKPQGAAAERYLAALKTWIGSSHGATGNEIIFQTRTALLGSGRDAGVAFATWLFGVRRYMTRGSWAPAIPLWQSADGFAEMRAAFDVVPPAERLEFLTGLGLGQVEARDSVPQEAAQALLVAWPDLLREVPGAQGPVVAFGDVAVRVPAADAQEALVAVTRVLGTCNSTDLLHGSFHTLLRSGASPSIATFWDTVVVPSLGRMWEAAPAERSDLLSLAWVVLLSRPAVVQDPRELTAFVTPHFDDMPENIANALAHRPDVLPLVAWVPHVPAGVASRISDDLPKADVEAVVREMTRDPATVTDGVAQFIVQHADEALRREALERIFRTAPLDRLRSIAQAATPVLGSVGDDALEAALSRALAAERPDLDVVEWFVLRLAARNPSDRLFPAVRALLAAADARHVLSGINASMSLGREELLPSLAGALDSMNATVRQKAKEAIDSIVELRRLREEARKQGR
jgi:hypothetical protein